MLALKLVYTIVYRIVEHCQPREHRFASTKKQNGESQPRRTNENRLKPLLGIRRVIALSLTAKSGLRLPCCIRKTKKKNQEKTNGSPKKQPEAIKQNAYPPLLIYGYHKIVSARSDRLYD